MWWLVALGSGFLLLACALVIEYKVSTTGEDLWLDPPDNPDPHAESVS